MVPGGLAARDGDKVVLVDKVVKVVDKVVLDKAVLVVRDVDQVAMVLVVRDVAQGAVGLVVLVVAGAVREAVACRLALIVCWDTLWSSMLTKMES